MFKLPQIISQAHALGEITPITDPPGAKFGSIEALVLGALVWIFGFAAGLAVIAVVYSGIMYITASGDSAKVEKAKNNLTWAIIGIVVTVLAIVIVQWTNNLLNLGKI